MTALWGTRQQGGEKCVGRKEIIIKPQCHHVPKEGTCAKAGLDHLMGLKQSPPKDSKILGLVRVENEILPAKSGWKEEEQGNLHSTIQTERKRKTSGSEAMCILEHTCDLVKWVKSLPSSFSLFPTHPTSQIIHAKVFFFLLTMLSS